jgi:Glycosyl transferase family 2
MYKAPSQSGGADRNVYFAALTSIVAGFTVMVISRSSDLGIIPYVASLSIGSAAVFYMVRRTHAPGRAFVFGVALLLHAIALAGVAHFEDDYFRFIWDGWQTISSGSPYGVAPSEYFGAPLPDASLAMTLDGINNPKIPTIYGPTLQFVYALAYAVSGTDPLGLRLLFAGFNLILVALLLRWTTAKHAALYAWCPLAIAEVVIHIHPDAIMAALLLTGLLRAKRYPALAGLAFGFAAGAKIVALALWPFLARMGWRAAIGAALGLGVPYLFFLLQGNGAGFASTRVFAGDWYFNPMGLALLNIFLPSSIARIAAGLIGISVILILHARTRSLASAPIAMMFGTILILAPAVNAWYLLWILPFAVGAPSTRAIWPFAATILLPLSYLTGLNLENPALLDFEVYPAARAAQIILLLAAICWDLFTHFKQKKTAGQAKPICTPIQHPRIAVIIPALNEEASIGDVVRGIKAQNWLYPPYVIVADNGSTDDTVKQADAAGAKIIREPNRGYGAACLAGIATVPIDTNIILFMDGDGADVAEEAPALIEPLTNGNADLVIGSRALGQMQAGAMTHPQRFGNWLATRLIWLIWGKRMTDLGPYRAIRVDALTHLNMQDRDYGWTIEMQVKAVQQDMRIMERPADYRRRIGISKISGTARGVLLAGHKILYVIGREAYFR